MPKKRSEVPTPGYRGALTFSQLDAILSMSHEQEAQDILDQWRAKAERLFLRVGYTAQDVALSDGLFILGDLNIIFRTSTARIEHVMALAEVATGQRCRPIDLKAMDFSARRTWRLRRNTLFEAYQAATMNAQYWDDRREHYYALVSDMSQIKNDVMQIQGVIESPGAYLQTVVNAYPGGASGLSKALGYSETRVYAAIRTGSVSLPLALRVARETGCDASRLHPELAA